jgi:hypothetical protein
MSSRSLSQSAGIAEASSNHAPATVLETRTALLKRSKRTAAPIAKSFVQSPEKSRKDRRGPLSVFVNNGDLRGLQAFCLLHAIISSGAGDNGWSTTLPIRTWARAFGITETATPQSASSAASKVLTRLEERQLIQRSRSGRARHVTVTLLKDDGSGSEYVRPVGASASDRFLTLPNEFWTDGWCDRLDLPALAMLLVALHEKPSFELVTARVPDWYGWSADTAERGFKTLERVDALRISKRTKKEPLAPDGITTVNVYTLLPPFQRPSSLKSPRGAKALKTVVAADAGKRQSKRAAPAAKGRSSKKRAGS